MDAVRARFHPGMDEPDRILVIRLKSIGDVVLTLPAVHLIRDNFPRARITFLTSKENVRLLEGFSPVDEVIGVDRVGNGDSGLRRGVARLPGGRVRDALIRFLVGETAGPAKFKGNHCRR